MPWVALNPSLNLDTWNEKFPSFIHVPRTPRDQRGRQLDHLVSSLDYTWTILDYAGLEAPEFVDGRSLRPLVEGRELCEGLSTAAKSCACQEKLTEPTHPMLRFFTAVLLLLSLSLTARAKPNLIVIYTDDHGYADLGIHGVVKDIQTPNLDALARSGVVAKHGYSTAPQCVPSRAGLLTGKFPGALRSSNPTARRSTASTGRPPSPQRLQQAGYVTAQFGKWHLGPTPRDSRARFQACLRPKRATPLFRQHHARRPGPPDGRSAAARCITSTAVQPGRRVRHRALPRPAFLPLHRLPRSAHPARCAEALHATASPARCPSAAAQALGMLSAIDDGVGLITDTLKKHGLTEKTLIFFIGDNGAPLKIHKIDSPARRRRRRLGRQSERSAQRRKRHAVRGRHARALCHRLARHHSRRPDLRASGQRARCRRHRRCAGRICQSSPANSTA